MKLESLKNSLDSFWGNLSEGWRQLWTSASAAITSFHPGEKTNLPAHADIDDHLYLPGRGWSVLGGEVFQDEKRLIVRMEVPGMSKEDIDIQVQNDSLVISGEKRFTRENTAGRWQVMQCAYGTFRRVVPLPAAVNVNDVRATYVNGVLRVELPKVKASEPKRIKIKVV